MVSLLLVYLQKQNWSAPQKKQMHPTDVRLVSDLGDPSAHVNKRSRSKLPDWGRVRIGKGSDCGR